MKIVWSERTDSAQWSTFTRDLGGVYWWYGIAFGWLFIGVMFRSKK